MARGNMNAINIEADLSDGYKMLGFVSGLSTEVSTDRYIGSVITYAHSKMAEDFDTDIDTTALARKEALGHVYEWRMTGVPQGRLWQHTLTGRGSNRQASWTWKPSVTPILTPEERKAEDNPNDPINNVSDEELSRLSDRSYIFQWKAPVTEYGLPVQIVAKYARALFIPSFQAANGFYFAKSSTQQLANKGAGAFTAFWTMWWGTAAPALWDHHIKKTIENDLGKSAQEMARGAGRKRSKTFTVSTITSNDAAFEAGRNYAEAYIKGKARSYAAASKYIERYGKFGGEVNYPS